MSRKAILHIFTTHNNVLMTATDLTGAETICKVSGGMVTKGGSDSGGQFASTRAAERMAEMLAEKEFNQVIVKYRGAGGNRSHSAPGATSAIRAPLTGRRAREGAEGAECEVNSWLRPR